jgi:hypothetical protein
LTTTAREPVLQEAGADWIFGNCADLRISAQAPLKLELSSVK